MAKVLARVSGIALKPGVSKNNRLYTREAIARMVADGQDRIAGGDGLALTDRQLLSQRTHHAAEDDSTHVIGRLSSLSLDEDGNARFTADIADTPHGRTIASLLDTSDGQPAFLKGVSIRGEWGGPVRKVKGRLGEDMITSDRVVLHGLDYTQSPGVPGAEVDGFEWAKHPSESESGRPMIYESVTEVRVTAITEEAPAAEVQAAGVTEGGPPPAAAKASPGIGEAASGALRSALALEPPHVLRNGECVTCARVGEAAKDPDKPYGDVTYADPGYQKDGKKRYPLDTAQHARSAYSYISQAKNAAFYSAAQLKRVKGRIIKALKGFGVKVAAEGWVVHPAQQLTESVAEMFGDPDLCGSWSINATNGPVSICLSSYAMDPADLDVVLRAAAASASSALAALDPDMDGDIDVPGAGHRSNPDGDKPKPKETAPTAPDPEETEVPAEPPAPDEPADVTETAPEDPAPEPETAPEEKADQAEKEPAVSEPTAQETAAGQTPAATTTETAAPAPAAPAAPAGITLTSEMFQALLDRVGTAPAAPAVTATETAPPAPAAPAPAQAAAPVETAPAAPVAPAPPVTETAEQAEARLVAEGVRAALVAEGYQVPGLAETSEQRVARLVQEQVTALKQQLVAGGQVTVQRAGLTAGGEVNEHRQPPVVPGSGPAAGVHPDTGLPTTWPEGGAKPLHKYSSEELAHYTGPVLDHHVMGRNASTELL